MSVGWSVIISGKLHFHVPIGVLVKFQYTKLIKTIRILDKLNKMFTFQRLIVVVSDENVSGSV